METPRNVVCLSNVPPELHNWLKMQALKMSQKSGRQVGLYQVVLLAIEQYKASIESQALSEQPKEVVHATG